MLFTNHFQREVAQRGQTGTGLLKSSNCLDEHKTTRTHSTVHTDTTRLKKLYFEKQSKTTNEPHEALTSGLCFDKRKRHAFLLPTTAHMVESRDSSTPALHIEYFFTGLLLI